MGNFAFTVDGRDSAGIGVAQTICHGDRSTSAKKRKRVLLRYQICRRVCCKMRVTSVATGPRSNREKVNGYLAAALNAQAASCPLSCGNCRNLSTLPNESARPRSTISGMPNVQPLLTVGATLCRESAFKWPKLCVLAVDSLPKRRAISSKRTMSRFQKYIGVDLNHDVRCVTRGKKIRRIILDIETLPTKT